MIDAVNKSRIISHLNKSHQRVLSHYLRHYLHFTRYASKSPTLVDLSLHSMTIQTKDGKTHSIPFDPPLESSVSIRPRLMSMDTEAMASLGAHEIQIKEYVPPRIFRHRLVAGLCVATYISFFFRPLFSPGTNFYLNKVQGNKFWETIVWMQGAVVIPMLLIHFTEIYFLDKNRLKKHDVEIGSLVWWKWMISCFIEGFGAFERIDWLAAEEQRRWEVIESLLLTESKVNVFLN
jgi:hypothetical protein